MTTEGLAIEVRHADRLCYAMQQSAVPWLHGLTLRNDGPDARGELVVKVSLQGFSDRVECRVDELPVGASLELDAPDLPLRADAFAGLLERTRAALQVEVLDGEAVVAEVNFLIRGMARDRILEGTAPKTPLDVRLDVGSQRARLSAPQMPDIAGSIDGRPFPWKTKRGDRSTIAMTYADNALKVRFRGDGADSRYTYRFDPSGDSIRLGVFIRHRLMPSPLRFRLSYRRKGA